MKVRKKVFASILAVLLLSVGSFASAGTTYESYSVTVPKLNFSVKTDAQTKSSAGRAANLKVSTLGKAVDVRAYGKKGGTGNWVRVSTTGTYNLPNDISKGDSTRAHFSSDLTTIVNVSVKGKWRSN
ncbi:hypothetical protein HXA31_00800 [Salipaludibacillus agaradhaerens]|jgi:hypothetical protein|uniref:Uncharacterized protein n=1 Tax=Salipaludibacillus agaradhaerens TaxID=76935 RepID=A0A9Q4B392_SALAG|nr:hypothetical protein [Salipaludibacillus agaradhaerens]MCR6097613.1 hypothetical protein [Salipaludibacillus agaradhaerens]MCR6112903.1 hypothetical protein [Salipaludibacillus agaradhaerens]